MGKWLFVWDINQTIFLLQPFGFIDECWLLSLCEVLSTGRGCHHFSLAAIFFAQLRTYTPSSGCRDTEDTGEPSLLLTVGLGGESDGLALWSHTLVEELHTRTGVDIPCAEHSQGPQGIQVHR